MYDGGIWLTHCNHLSPSQEVHRRIPPSLGSRLSAVGASGLASQSRRGRVSTSGGTAVAASAVETLVAIGSSQDIAEPLRPGRTFSFQLTFTNPLYDAVEVLAELLDPLDEEGEEEQATCEKEGDVVRGAENPAKVEIKQPWNVSMPSSTFGINPYAEAWEYEDEEDETETSIDGLAASSSGGTTTVGTGPSSSGNSTSRRRKHGPGILAKKGNKTAVQLDLAIGREATAGDIRVPLFITYTYTVEDSLATTASAKRKDADAQKLKEEKEIKGKEEVTQGDDDGTSGINSNLKTFSFWASIPLGIVVPRSAVPGGGSTLSVIAGHGSGEAHRVPSSSNLRVQ
jgi:dynactin-4